jgi:uncharacterized protein (TIGR00369 family)
MTLDEHYRRLERMYLDAPVNRIYQPQISIGDGQAAVTMTVTPDWYHAMGAVHGSVYFKGLDDAAYFAANSLLPDTFVLTASFTIHILRPIATGTMRATGRVVHRSRRILVADASMTSGEGDLIASGTGMYMPSGKSLADVAGYR